jgi:hypothetical protein
MMLLSAACSNAPPFQPGAPLVPSLLDGTTLTLVGEGPLIRLRSTATQRLGLAAFSMWDGTRTARTLEVRQTNDDCLELLRSTGLPPGSYTLRFRAGAVDESRLRPFFARADGEPNTWHLRVFVGS